MLEVLTLFSIFNLTDQYSTSRKLKTSNETLVSAQSEPIMTAVAHMLILTSSNFHLRKFAPSIATQK
jgi:hypothetical protein